MSKHVFEDGTEATVIHRMADGTIRDSIKGYKIPYNEQTAGIYEFLASWERKSEQEK